MKYLLILLLSLTFAAPAFAARQVPGMLPSSTPLQPLDAGIAPHFNSNISGNANGLPDQAETSSPPAGTDNVFDSGDQGRSVAAPTKFSVNTNTSSKIFFSIVLILLGGFIALRAFRKNEKK